MVQRPLADDPRRLLRQASRDDLASSDGDESLEALIAGMEMRRRMIVVIRAPDGAGRR